MAAPGMTLGLISDRGRDTIMHFAVSITYSVVALGLMSTVGGLHRGCVPRQQGACNLGGRTRSGQAQEQQAAWAEESSGDGSGRLRPPPCLPAAPTADVPPCAGGRPGDFQHRSNRLLPRGGLRWGRVGVDEH